MKKKSRDLKTWSKRNVPGDIWPEILSRLPVKTLLRFRCVCKSWQALIGDPSFAQLHLTRFSNNVNESHLFVVKGMCGKARCFVKSSKTIRTTAKLEVLQTDLPTSNTLRSTVAHGSSVIKWSVVCSTDGLFILRSCMHLMAWNPSIKKTLNFPLPPQPFNGFWLDFGLGFDSLLKDYKYVRFAKPIRDGVLVLAIYTFGTNLWKTIELQGQSCSKWLQGFSIIARQTLCFRGILYALARSHGAAPSQLVSFDLSKEVSASNRLPADVKLLSEVLTMTDGENSIAIVCMSSTEGFLWVLDSLGSAGINSCSWTQRYTFSPMIFGTSKLLRDEFLYLKKNGDMLLNKDTTVTSYNLETQEEKIMLKRSLYEGDARKYIESLILL